MEKTWPYVGTDPEILKENGACKEVDQPPATVTGDDGVGIEGFTPLPAGREVRADGSVDIKDTLTLEKLLDEGRDIVFGTVVAWSTPDAEKVIDVKLGPAGQPIFGAGGHAMLIMGYDRRDPGRPHFLVKNSWGPNYGHRGYLHLSYDYVRTYAKYGYSTRSLREGKVSGLP